MNTLDYKKLISYKLARIVADLTWKFVPRYYGRIEDSRQRDQMNQAARSYKQNIVEGTAQTSLSGKLKLYSVAKASSRELLEDYEDILRREKLPRWEKNDPRLKRRQEEEEFEELGELGNLEETVNYAIDLLMRGGYLLDRQIAAVEEKHRREGGYRETILKKRLDFRRSLSVFLFFLLSLLFLFFSSSPVSAANSGIFTAELWVNPTSSVTSKAILGKSEELRIFTDGSGFVGCQIKSTTWQTGASGTSALTLNSWTHVACTYDKVTLRIYANGVQVGSQALTATVDDTANAIKIGQDDSASTPYGNLSGTVDNFQFYNYARSPAQIKADMLGRTSQGGSALGVMMAGPRDEYTPVAHWAFDDGYGTTVQDKGPNNQDLTLVNTPTWNNNGKLNKALDFEKDSSQYGYAADSATLSLTSSLTLTAWIKPESNTASTLFDIAGKWDGTNESYLLAQYGDEIRMYIDAAANYKTTDAANLSTGTWYHVAAVYDATAQTVTLYINGVATAGTTTGTIPSSIGDDTGRFQVGAEDSTTTAANFYDGLIDEPKVYNFALTADQVKIDYNAGSALRIGYSAGDDPETGLEASLAGNPPVGEWKMDEKTGQSANDTSGNGNTGTLGSSGGADSTDPTWVSGKVGQALSFDGGDYVNVPDNNSLDVTIVTLEAWVKPGSTGGGINSKGVCAGSSDTAWLWNILSNKQAVWSSGGPWYYSNSVVPVGQWSHVVLVFTPQKWKFYLNGNPDGEISVSYSSLPINTYPFVIGAQRDCNFFNGPMDHVKIFDYARSQQQIAYDYNRGGPVGWWKFDECQGGTANDASGKGNNGTITIGVTGSQDGIGTCTDGDITNARYNGVTGKRNSSLNFDGTDDYVSVLDSDSLDLVGTKMSFSFWYNASPTEYTVFLTKYAGAYPALNGYEVYLYTGGYIYFGTYHATAGIYQLTSNTAPTPNQWNHIVCVRDGANRYIYLNGVLDKSGSSWTDSLIGSTANLTMNPQSSIYLDEVKIYNYALSAAQIKKAYNENSSVRFGPSSGSP